MIPLVLLAGCASRPPEIAPGALPPRAPAVALLATMVDGVAITVDGSTVSGDLTVDLDGPTDDRDAFRYQILDDGGDVLYERTTNGPVLVRDFLDYWSGQSGVDILGSFPKLGSFAVQVPLLDGGSTVNFQLRDDDGVYQDAGHYDLSSVDGDDVGLSDAVIGAETLYSSGPSENRLDIAIVGDGYTADEMDLWKADAQALADDLLATPPLSTYADFINVHRVDAVSAESGASFDSPDASVRDTAFGTIFPIEAVDRLTGANYNARAVFQLEQWEVARAVSTVPWDVVIVVSNSQQYGGMAIHFATVTTAGHPTQGDPWTDTGVHEFGHILGILGDEYVNDACIRTAALGLPRNITDDPENPPWSGWIEDGTPLPTKVGTATKDKVGAFEGAYNCPDLYRPQYHCKMQDSATYPFCAACTELLVERIFRFVDPVDDLVVDGRTAKLTGPRTDLPVTWKVNGEERQEGTLADGFELPRAGLGMDDLEVDVSVPADEVRDDPYGDMVEKRSYVYR